MCFIVMFLYSFLDDINEQVSARMDLPNVQSLLQRGFSQENVRKAIKKQLTLTGKLFCLIK